MKVIIDRFEEDYAVVELEAGKTVAIPRILVPNTKEGDVISIQKEEENTQLRKEKIEGIIKQIFEE